MKTNIVLPTLAFISALNAAALVRRVDAPAHAAPQIDQQAAAAPIDAVQDQPVGVEAANRLIAAAAADPPAPQAPQQNLNNEVLPDPPIGDIPVWMLPIIQAPKKAKLQISDDDERQTRYHKFQYIMNVPGYIITAAQGGRMEELQMHIYSRPIPPPTKALQTAVESCFESASERFPQERDQISHLNVMVHPPRFPNAMKVTCKVVIAEPGQQYQANAIASFQSQEHVAAYGVAESSVIYKLAPAEEQGRGCHIM